MTNREYWKQRSEQRLVDSEKLELRFETEMKRAFDGAAHDLELQVSKLYATYAKDNHMSYAAAQEYLTNNELKEFKRGLSFYIEKAKDKNYRREYRAYLQALSTRARIRRLEAMKAELKEIGAELYDGVLNPNSRGLMQTVFNEAYNRTAFDFSQDVGVMLAFHKPSRHVLNALLEYPWSGKNFSQKWQAHCSSFDTVLEDVLTRGIIQGKSVQTMARELRDKTNRPYQNAVTLIRTETNFIHNSATAAAYSEFGVEEYDFLATLDLKTSEMCREHDGKRYKLAEKAVGVNYPPLHARCRSTTIPVVDDDESGARFARDLAGNPIKVSADMKYSEWKVKVESMKS